MHREFVVNIVSHWMLEAANITCGDFEHNESEWEAANLTPLPSTKVCNTQRMLGYCNMSSIMLQ